MVIYQAPMFRRKSPLPPKLNTNDATAFPELSSKKVSQPLPAMNFAGIAWAQPKTEVIPKTEIIKPSAKDATPDMIMGRLAEMYETWKEYYIETWGYEDYERNYRFHNYDYEYFDKLDELYEKMLEEEEEKEREKEAEEEFTTDGPEYEEYLQDE
jgi:hypothetical protein